MPGLGWMGICWSERVLDTVGVGASYPSESERAHKAYVLLGAQILRE